METEDKTLFLLNLFDNTHLIALSPDKHLSLSLQNTCSNKKILFHLEAIKQQL
jgi:hypothetical protein